MSYEIYSYKIALKLPLKLKGKTFTNRKGLILKHTDQEGRVGFGEVAPLPFFSKESLKDALNQLKGIIHHLQQKKTVNCQNTLPSVAFGLACSSIKELPKKISIPYSSLLIGNPEDILKKLALTSTNSVKIKIHHLDLSRAIELFQEIKKHYPNKRIRVDFNQSLTLKEAIQFCKQFSPADFEFLEEPCLTKKECIYLHKETQFPIAIDESLTKLEPDELKHIAALVIKPTIIGDVSKWVKKNKPIVFSSSFESKVGIFYILKLASKYSLYDPGIDTIQFMDDNAVFSSLEQTQGYITLEKPLINTKELCYVPLD